MVTEIQYKSNLIRLWYGSGRANPGQVPIPEAEEGAVPQWLEQALSSEPFVESSAARSSQRGGERNDLYAQVEHIQTGRRWNFDTMDGLLGFLREQDGEGAFAAEAAP